ncbi:mlr0821 [Mesorhizobium japonicum MAFF 303099]|uniref:Mlr0821 protein n=1 Tax=Mesorhizobium japonicum (strain LMG 29417 / CECT 9101 / MAFF 303099) TaxID=266835 RepID=Q98LY5_RHILO|nr:mlr0821 [Mesorhizobium japonicum MAFF 303099]
MLQSTLERTTISRDTNKAVAFHQTFGDRLADTIARIGGSWSFILGFIAFLILWTSGNVWLLTRDAFDPYPFIFLNLVLSMVAALQAPVIMMAQNRQTERDRIDAAHDYEVNLKAEIEIMALHEKLDELRHSQIIGMRDEIVRLAEAVKSIDERLARQQSAS